MGFVKKIELRDFIVLCSAFTDTMLIFVKKLSILSTHVNLRTMCYITGRIGEKGSGEALRRLIEGLKVNKGER